MINKVILIGRVGKDPTVQHLESNTAVARFTVATDESYTSKEGQRIEQTEWHNIAAWRNSAKYAEDYVRKGMLMYIEGRLRTYSYEKDGQKRYFTEIVSENMRILNYPKDSNSAQTQQTPQQQVPPVESTPIPDAAPTDDLPF